jgi:signal transduction histidine kinase/CheY-like chemotaxis protein
MAQNIENLLNSNASNETILEFLTEESKNLSDSSSLIPEFLKVFAYVRGEFLDGNGWIPPEGFYSPGRPWYIGAVEKKGEVFLSEPYLDAETGGMCLAFSQQIFTNQGEPLGIIAMDLRLNTITEYIAAQTIAQNGYGMLIRDNDIVFAHKDENIIGSYLSDNKAYNEIAEILHTQDIINAYRFIDYDGTDSIAYFRTIFNGWHVGVISPVSSYYSGVRELAIVLCGVGFALVVSLSVIIIWIQMKKMKADEDSKSKSSFLARMSHEMRTPMNAIIGMSDIAKKSDDPERIKYALGQINIAAEHLLGVINDVLDMSKIEAGKIEIVIEAVAIHSIIDRAVSVNKLRMDEKQQDFTLSIDKSVPEFVKTDGQRLAQVLSNLLSNAYKFTPEGGHISLSVSANENENGLCELLFKVCDDGIGLSQEQQSRLFRSFEQADNSISRKYGGTGLGLSISRHIVQLLGGSVGVISRPGAGSEFFFTITVERVENYDEHNKVTGDTTAVFSGKSILLTEDVAVNREIIHALLEDSQVKITDAADGVEALSLYTKKPAEYDLVLMDIHMPVMDGLEATKRIREFEKENNLLSPVPIIAMTANVFREDVEKCLAAGMNAHIGKPINIGEMFRAMGKYLSSE